MRQEDETVKMVQERTYKLDREQRESKYIYTV